MYVWRLSGLPGLLSICVKGWRLDVSDKPGSLAPFKMCPTQLASNGLGQKEKYVTVRGRDILAYC